MGATAFVLAEFAGIPYRDLMIAAFLPAVLYFVCIWWQVHFEALKHGFKGLEEHEIPDWRSTLRTGFWHVIPLLVLVYMLLRGRSVTLAGVYGMLAVPLVALITRPRITLEGLWKSVDDFARNVAVVGIATAVAGSIVGVISLTGVGTLFQSALISITGNISIVAVTVVMLCTMVLGMGMPTTPAYLIVVSIAAPILVELGFPVLAAHMFVFYYACLSFITPPVALSAYAAASLAGSSPNTVGWLSLRLGIAGFIVPYMFLYSPAMFLKGSAMEILVAVVFSFVCVTALAAVLEGWLVDRLTATERLLLLLGAIVLVPQDLATGMAGLILLIVGYALHRRRIGRLEKGGKPVAVA